MTSCFMCTTLNFNRKKSTGTEPPRIVVIRIMIQVMRPKASLPVDSAKSCKHDKVI